MSQYLSYQCPQTNVVVELTVSADSLDEVEFRTLTVEDRASCYSDHVLEKSDLSLGAQAPD